MNSRRAKTESRVPDARRLIPIAASILFWAIALSGFPASLRAAEEVTTGSALLVNGAPPGSGDYGDNFWELDHARELFSGWKQTILSSSGSVPASVLNGMAETKDFNFIYHKRSGDPELRHYDEPGARPADLPHFISAFKAVMAATPAGQTMFVLFAGHGGRGRTVMAGRRDLSVNELRRLLQKKNPDLRTIFVFDTCMSASMFPALLSVPNACGFSAAGPDEYANSGEVVMDEAIKKKGTVFTFSDVLHEMRGTVDTDSFPMATSDYFLKEYYESHSRQKIVDAQGALNEADCLLQSKGPVFSNAVAAALIKPEISRLKRDLPQKDLASAGEIQSQEKALTKAIKRVLDEDDQLWSREKPFYVSFIKSQMGDEDWNKFSAEKKKLDELRRKLESLRDPTQIKEVQAQIGAIEPGYATLFNRIQNLKTAVNYPDHPNHGTKLFRRFVSYMGARTPGFVCPADIAKNPPASHNIALCENDTENVAGELIDKRLPLLRASSDLEEIAAVEMMAQKHDYGAMNKYFELLECESTKFRGGS